MTQPNAVKLSQIAAAAIARNEEIKNFAFPKRIATPLLSRYEPGMTYGAHADAPFLHCRRAAALRRLRHALSRRSGVLQGRRAGDPHGQREDRGQRPAGRDDPLSVDDAARSGAAYRRPQAFDVHLHRKPESRTKPSASFSISSTKCTRWKASTSSRRTARACNTSRAACTACGRDKEDSTRRYREQGEERFLAQRTRRLRRGRRSVFVRVSAQVSIADGKNGCALRARASTASSAQPPRPLRLKFAP